MTWFLNQITEMNQVVKNVSWKFFSLGFLIEFVLDLHMLLSHFLSFFHKQCKYIHFVSKFELYLTTDFLSFNSSLKVHKIICNFQRYLVSLCYVLYCNFDCFHTSIDSNYKLKAAKRLYTSKNNILINFDWTKTFWSSY